MSANTDLIYDAKRKMLAKYPRFGSEIAVANIEFKDNLKYHTAATDGKNIYVDPKYFASLSENDRLFTIAHEIMHIKFMHMFRLKDKSGVKRDPELWNIATDAIINANLERDGFTIKEGYVNMPEALNYSAEEFYQKLLQEKEKKEQEQKNNQNQEQEDGQEQEQDNQQGSGQSQQQDNEQNQEQDKEQGNGQDNDNSEQTENQNSDEGKSQGDDHSLWEEAFKEQQNSQKKGQRQDKNSQKQEDGQEQEQTEEEQPSMDFDERGEFEDNRKEKREKFKSRREKTEKDIRSTDKGTIELGNIGKSKEEIDWKLLIRKEIEKSETIWSQRRSIAENNYAYRLEENEIEDDAETEVMIDVSGSVDLELVKSFLRQLKPLLKQSKLRVGCFNEKFWGLVDIKNVKDIDKFTIPREARGDSAWTEDWDLAVRSFTKKREINKIVFTDGYPCPGTMPKEDLKRENVIWLVYGNEDFEPCCGKVINITEKQLEQLHQIDKSSYMDDIDR
ncbi:MAG TPA: hypothetical protein DCZ30_02575 [Clostridiales bacterium]|nr:hypothetical protein [Clostridiales bacterium]